MKYETYKQLTEQEKEEWNFKFKNIEYPYMSLTYLLILYSYTTIFLFMSFIILKEYVVVKLAVTDLLLYTMQISFVITFVWFFDYIGKVLFFIFKKYQENRFLKKCGVK